MPPGLEFGVDQVAIQADFKAPAIRRFEPDRSDARFEMLEQFTHQADRPVSVMSNSAINDDNVDLFHLVPRYSIGVGKNYNMPSSPPRNSVNHHTLAFPSHTWGVINRG